MVAPLLALALMVAKGDAPLADVPVHVDSRVELLTLVFRLIGAGEFGQTSSRSPYSEEIEFWFGEARDHEVFERARALRGEHGISFNAVPDLAVHLTPPPELALRVPLEPWPERLDKRWMGADLEGFLLALRDFAEETSFLEFHESFQETHHAAEASLAARIEEACVIEWLGEFFGLAPGTTYVAVPGLLCGSGNYGASVRLADGSLELWPILGASRWDKGGHPLYDAGSVSLVAHEFTHAFANPVIDAHWPALAPSFERLYQPVREVMESQAYSTPRTMAYESLVRACVVRHAARTLGPEGAQRQSATDVGRGFRWTPALAHLLERYESERARYPSLTDFGGDLTEFFSELAKNSLEAGHPASEH